MRNAHLQTMFGTAFRRPPPLPATLEHWSTEDDDFLRVHLWPSEEAGPLVLMLHGLEGSIQSPYLVGQARVLHALGYTVVVMEHRSCGGPLNRARRLYHSGETSDLNFVVQRLVARYPTRPILIYGVSLGGNQVAKWLGTHPIPDAVRGAVVISPPFDLTISGPHMDRRGLAYVQYFLRTLIPKALAKERQYPGCMDADAVRSSKTFEAFDTHATAALHGFEDAMDYYRKSSCGQFLSDIRTPTLLIAAHDDPFNPGRTIPHGIVDSSSSLIGLFPRRGGHVGFVADSVLQPRYWLETVTTQFYEAVR